MCTSLSKFRLGRKKKQEKKTERKKLPHHTDVGNKESSKQDQPLGT